MAAKVESCSLTTGVRQAAASEKDSDEKLRESFLAKEMGFGCRWTNGGRLTSSEEHLLAISFSGRGLFAMESGERIARDYEEPSAHIDWLNEDARAAKGIGPIADAGVPVAGLWGGALSTSAPTGWAVFAEPAPNETVTVSLAGKREELTTPITDLRIFGFSPSHRFIVVATSSEIEIFEMNQAESK